MNDNFRRLSVMLWNVRGLDDSEKCDVRDAIASAAPSVCCLQETKLHDITTKKARTFLPPALAASHHFLGASGTRGGILTAWNPNLFNMDSFIARKHTLTTVLASTMMDLRLTITKVYAPADHRDTHLFLDGLRELLPHIHGPWLLAGDFNLIRCAEEKNTSASSSPHIAAFNQVIHDLCISELPFLDCSFTWSNMRAVPTLARMDRMFVNNAQCIAFPQTSLSSLVRQTSDHTPIIVHMSTQIPKSTLFRFENAWLHNNLFLPTVLPAWHEAPATHDAAGNLAGCLKYTRAAAKVWARHNRAPPTLIPNCKFLVLLFDTLEEDRVLSVLERQVRSMCHERLCLAIKERAAVWGQRGKRRAVREGDSNTAFFHAHATQRLRRNAIRGIEVNGLMITSHQHIVAALTTYYKSMLGTTSPGPGTSMLMHAQEPPPG